MITFCCPITFISFPVWNLLFSIHILPVGETKRQKQSNLNCRRTKDPSDVIFCKNICIWRMHIWDIQNIWIFSRWSSNSCNINYQLPLIAVFLVFCLFKVFQKVDHFQQIPSQTWNVAIQILSRLHSLNHPWRALNYLNSFCGWMPKFKTKFKVYSLWMGCSRKNQKHKVT